MRKSQPHNQNYHVFDSMMRRLGSFGSCSCVGSCSCTAGGDKNAPEGLTDELKATLDAAIQQLAGMGFADLELNARTLAMVGGTLLLCYEP